MAAMVAEVRYLTLPKDSYAGHLEEKESSVLEGLQRLPQGSEAYCRRWQMEHLLSRSCLAGQSYFGSQLPFVLPSHGDGCSGVPPEVFTQLRGLGSYRQGLLLVERDGEILGISIFCRPH